MALKTSSAIVEGYFVLCADEAIKGNLSLNSFISRDRIQCKIAIF